MNSDESASRTEPPWDTNYAGVFGTLCKHIPLLDVQAPRDWKVAYRSFSLTAWHNPLMSATLICEKSSDGWNIYVKDHDTGSRCRCLPKNSSRWNAFEAARAFLNGEPLMVADSEGEANGLIKEEMLKDE